MGFSTYCPSRKPSRPPAQPINTFIRTGAWFICGATKCWSGLQPSSEEPNDLKIQTIPLPQHESIICSSLLNFSIRLFTLCTLVHPAFPKHLELFPPFLGLVTKRKRQSTVGLLMRRQTMSLPVWECNTGVTNLSGGITQNDTHLQRTRSTTC